ncbi:nuclear transport factor 2 family protein [Pseudomaricurvus sp. HS19]|uniref:nuclear transport factor 2 family protein n=1 Tax=Pseudomaricurvus sp. HS19 TaxID=2692626 RepID=UPI00136916F8|nr:nuclear transport factor 2 family protein [Pseudomaricurvus sp. HS19]MYM61912.1 nuclear transport factor 2 family protein [Pseudomaricurvus sp. HS19]
MSENNSRQQAWLDRLDITDCIARLARGEDRRDATLISGSFSPDAIIDMGVFKGPFSQYLEWVVPGDPALPVTAHTLGQSVVELDGDTACAETYVTSYHRVDTGEEHRDTAIGGRYLDRLEKRDGEWRIVERTLLYDWFMDYGVAVDWSQGVMGLPFNGDHYTGRSQPGADFSDKFFGK